MYEKKNSDSLGEGQRKKTQKEKDWIQIEEDEVKGNKVKEGWKGNKDSLSPVKQNK